MIGAPLDPCGLAVDIVRTCGVLRVRFWQGLDDETLIRTYRVPWDRPCLPIPHRFWLPQISDFMEKEELRDDQPGVITDWGKYDKGRTPRWPKTGLQYCGSERAWRDGARPGIDPPLTWLRAGISTCCVAKGVIVMALTANQVPVATGAGDEIVDGSITDNGDGSISIPGRVCLGYLCIPLANVADLPPVGEVYVYLDEDGKLALRGHDNSVTYYLRQDDADALYEPVGTATSAVAALSATLGTAATHAASDFDAAGAATSAVGALSATLGTAATHSVTDFMQSSNNLSELTSLSTARGNLGLGTSATHAVADFVAAGTTPVLLASGTVSAGSTLDLTGLTGFEHYRIVLSDVRHSSSLQNLWMRTSSNGGSSYDAGASDYTTGFGTDSKVTTTSYPDTSAVSHTGVLVVDLWSPGGTAHYKQLTFRATTYEGSMANDIQGQGVRLATSAINALRFLPASGTLSCTYRVFGQP